MGTGRLINNSAKIVFLIWLLGYGVSPAYTAKSVEQGLTVQEDSLIFNFCYTFSTNHGQRCDTKIVSLILVVEVVVAKLYRTREPTHNVFRSFDLRLAASLNRRSAASVAFGTAVTIMDYKVYVVFTNSPR